MLKKLSRVFHVGYLVLFAFIIAAVCMTYCGNMMNLPLKMDSFDFKSIFIGIFMAAAVIFVYAVFKEKISPDGKRINILYAAAAVIMAAVQIFLVFELKTQPYSDSGFVDAAARAYAMGEDFSHAVKATEGHTTYFFQFPNNWALLIFLSGYYKAVYLLAGEIPFYAVGLFNTAFIQLGMFMLYRCLRLMFKDNRKTALCILLMMGYAPLYTYSSYCYTDSVSLPFVTAAVYFIIKAKRAESTKAFFAHIIAAGSVIAVGYSVKGSLIVILVASVIYLAVNIPVKRWLPAAGIMAVMLVVFNMVILHGFAIGIGIATPEQLEKHRFPTAHWVMMGLKDEGGFDVEDHNFTKFQPDYDTRRSEDIKVLKKRLSDMDAYDICEHYGKKLGFTWGDGTYYINRHLKYTEKNAVKYIVCHGKKALLYFQSYHFMILLAMALSVVSGALKCQKDSMAYVRLAVFGLTVFLLIWETRSRYLFNFIPLILIMAADGIDFAAGKFNAALKKRKQSHERS